MDVTEKEYKETVKMVSQVMGKNPQFYRINSNGERQKIDTKLVIGEFLKRKKHVEKTVLATSQSDPVADLIAYNGKV